MTARKRSSTSSDALGESLAETELASFIAKFEPGVAQLIRECRDELRAVFPAANELVYDNYNFFVIGYCSSLRASDCIVSIAAAANGVGLSFYRGATLADPTGLLEGSGKQNRFLRLPTADRLRDPEVLRLMHAAAANGTTKLPDTGTGRLIIKSVSAKQRPRRRGGAEG